MTYWTDEQIRRRRARWQRRNDGRWLWWLLLPGWEHRR